MKAINLALFLMLLSSFLQGQEVPKQNPKKVAPNDTIVAGKVTREKQLEKIEQVKVKLLSDSIGNEPQKKVPLLIRPCKINMAICSTTIQPII